MRMAKKEIFSTQSIFFCQLDVIKQLFLSFDYVYFETKFVFFRGGGREASVFNILSSNSSLFSFCHPFLQHVLLPTLLSFLCVEFWLANFSGKEQRVAGK